MLVEHELCDPNTYLGSTCYPHSSVSPSSAKQDFVVMVNLDFSGKMSSRPCIREAAQMLCDA